MIIKGIVTILASLFSLWLMVSDVKAETYFTITYYMVGEDAYGGITPVNGVIRFPKGKEEPIECIDQISKLSEHVNDNSISKCSKEMKDIISSHELEIVRIFNYYNPNKIAIFSPKYTEDKYLFINWFYGGSGGGQNNWGIYDVNQVDGIGHSPILSGIEVTPGGNVWYELYCDNKSYDKCAEEIFYPKKYAYQMIFTDKGVITRSLPKKAKNP